MLFGEFMSRDLGIDLGTANVLVFVKGRGVVIREPSVVAVRNDRFREVLAVGEEAKLMIGRTPGNIVAVRPLQDGVIADFDTTEAMLRYFIRKASPRFGFRPRVVVCVPCGVTEVEKRAVEDAAHSAGARETYLVEEPMASAIGSGLPVQEPVGSMIVDIGGGTSEVAVLSMGGIVTSQSIRVAGSKLDEAIVSYMKREYNMAIGERSAEEIKIQIGSAYPMQQELSMEIRGLDLSAGLPMTMEITSSAIYEALLEPVALIINAIKQTLEKTPPELSSDIMERGIMLAGGGALLNGLDMLITQETGIHVMIPESPLDSVAIGVGVIMEEMELLQKISQAYGK